MAKKPVYEFELDDDEDSLDDDTAQLIYDKYMEDISEIMSRAFNDIGLKVEALVDALREDDE